MVRIITQETYDEVVKENIDEFGMSPEEAIQDAVTQFEAQGVNLANIIKDLALSSGEEHLVSSTISKLKTLSDSAESTDKDFVTEVIVLKTECEKDLARKMRAGKEGAYNVLLAQLQKRVKLHIEGQSTDEQVIVDILRCLVALMDGQPDYLEANGIDLIKSILDNTRSDDILLHTLKWTHVCCVKHEMNKQNLFAKDVAANFRTILKEHKDKKIISETLQVMRKFTLDDDVRVEFGKTHDHAKEIGAKTLEIIVDMIKEHRKPPLVSELMLTAASLLVRNELCASVAQSVPALVDVMGDNYDCVAVVTQGYKLITALAGNDDVKRKIVASGISPIIISLLNRHASHAAASALGLKCVAALALREAAHSSQLADSGAPEAVVGLMKVHKGDGAVMQNACRAIRNMVARCREHSARYRDLGAEALLQHALVTYEKEFGYDVRAALRDLECDVRLDEQWTGKGVSLEQ